MFKMNQLHSGARWIFRLRAYYPLFFIGFFITIYGFQFLRVFTLIKRISIGDSIVFVFIIAILFYILFMLIIGEIYARLAYRFWKYEFIDEQLKLERGIIWKRYSNVPYERVQNVNIKRGIIARMFGFSSVEIETAGYSSPFGNSGFKFGSRTYHSEGYIPAVSIEEAEQIREFLMKKVSKRK